MIYKMASEDTIDITNIIKDIESGKNSPRTIIKKYNLTSYKYYRIINEGGIKNPHPKKGPAGVPKNTAFKKLLNQHGTDELTNDFNVEDFKKDCLDHMKLSELMEKYKLSLYQVRELRKKYGLIKTQ
jgi:Mor family transcriptional regulator